MNLGYEIEYILVLTLEKMYTIDEVSEHFMKRNLFKPTVSVYGSQMPIFGKDEYRVCIPKQENGLYKIYLYRLENKK